MRHHRSDDVRLRCEQLECRVTPALAYGLTETGALVSFDTANPTTGSSFGVVQNVTGGETLVAIDIRPATGQLYALGVSASGAGSLYTVTVSGMTSTATLVGTAGSVTPIVPLPNPGVSTSGYGFDFNPVIDRIRIVTTAGQSIVLNPDTGIIQTNAPALNTGAISADASAYTNNNVLATVTTLYAIDASSDQLYIQTPATSVLTAQGVGLGVNIDVVNGFDIPVGVNVNTANTPAVGSGFLAATNGVFTNLYSIDLTTGVATLIGTIGTGITRFRGLAISLGPTVAFQSATYSVTEGTASVDLVLTRTDTTVAQSVTVSITGGTATPGSDLAAGPFTVNFGVGQSTAMLTIPIVDDTTPETSETAILSISSITNEIRTDLQKTTTLTIADNGDTSPPVVPPVTPPPPPPPPSSVVATSGGTVQIRKADGTTTTITPYAGFAGGTNISTGDVNGDGVMDTATGTATGSSHVKVFDGATGAVLRSFLAFDGFAGGISIAFGDLNRDGVPDLIVGAAAGANGGHVKVFDGATGSLLTSFLTFDGFVGGVNVAAGDLNRDGTADIVVTAKGTSHVKVFDGATRTVLRSFLALPVGSASVAAGDVNGDGTTDLVIGNATSGSQVRVLDGQSNAVLFDFSAFPGFEGGVRVGARDVNGDGTADILVGTVVATAHVKAFSGRNLNPLQSFIVSNSSGVFVG